MLRISAHLPVARDGVHNSPLGTSYSQVGDMLLVVSCRRFVSLSFGGVVPSWLAPDRLNVPCCLSVVRCPLSVVACFLVPLAQGRVPRLHYDNGCLG